MFAAEAEGLDELAASGTIRVPRPICHGVADGQAYLVLEALELGGSGAMEAFGAQLAAMHRHTGERFGWHRDNTIGSTLQPNDRESDWVTFWRARRLGFQLEQAAGNGCSRALLSGGEELMERLPALFTDYRPAPSLLHGDLWGGNYAVTSGGEPVIFDPAVYYGDREADLAMTELFGGFGTRFYAAYNAAWPLDPGYPVRKTLYNLYHVLNHFNMFGGGYAGQAESMVGRLLAELR
jgi:fructosamine-3-kinase